MKTSIFKDGKYSIGVDYGNREDCVGIFEITNIEKEQLEKGSSFEIIDNKLVISSTPEYLENIKEQELEALKQEKAEAILKVATLTDQLNLTAGTLDVVVDMLAELKPEILEHSWVIESKAKLEEIKTILNK